MVVREEVAGRPAFSGGSPCVTRVGFFGGGRGATSSEWSSRAGSVGFVDLEQGMGRGGRAWAEQKESEPKLAVCYDMLVAVAFYMSLALTSTPV